MARCRVCKQQFEKRSMSQVVCGMACSQIYARLKRAKKEKDDLRKAKIAAKTRWDWMREAQSAFNAYIRKRDEDDSCISCGRDHKGQWHAGHYLSTSSRPALRFTETNVHKQCSACNLHLHGNLIAYRLGLIDKIGTEEVERLENDRSSRKFSIPELEEIKEIYKRKLKELQNADSK